MHRHRIRLRGPWECEPLARHSSQSEPLPPPCRMTMPCRWDAGGLVDFAGKVGFVRRFGAPARLDTDEQLWLTFEGADASAVVWLNGQLLGRHEGANEAFEFEITAHLKLRNELSVEVESSSTSGGLWGEVALEVRKWSEPEA